MPASNCLLVLCSCSLSRLLQRSFWNCSSTMRTETSPVQSELCSYILLSIFINQSEQFYSHSSEQCFLDQCNCEDLEFLFTWRWTNQKASTSVYIRQLSSGSGCILSFYTACFPAGGETPKTSCQSRVESISTDQHRPAQTRAKQGRADWTTPDWIRAELSSWRGALP